MNIDHLKTFLAAQGLYLLCVIVGIILSSIFIIRDRWQQAWQTRLHNTGTLTTGTIIKRQRGLLFAYLTYRFEHEGKTYQRQQSVTAEAFDSTGEGATVHVYYAPTSPEHNVLADLKLLSFSHSMACACSMVTLIIGIPFIIFTLVALFQPVSAGP